MFGRPKPRYGWAEFFWPAVWQETSQPLLWTLCYIFKRSSAVDWLFLLTTLHSLSLFLLHENARNLVQGNPKFLKFYREACLQTPPPRPTNLHFHCPHAPPPPTKNRGYVPKLYFSSFESLGINLIYVRANSYFHFFVNVKSCFEFPVRPDQFNFLFYENFGQKIKIGGRKK